MCQRSRNSLTNDSSIGDAQETLKLHSKDRFTGILLEPTIGLRTGTALKIPSGAQSSVGRGSNALFRLAMDKWMSRLHFSIEGREDHAVVVDLGSSNGTIVNGQPVKETIVREGDEILAGTTQFKVRLIR